MTSDRDIAKKVWDGKIAIQFKLDSSELISQSEPPLPYYLLAPRGSYIRLITEGVRRYFQEHVHEVTDIYDEMWFSYNGKPLKWHYPIGVLFDTLAYDNSLPWNLTVHFSGFPFDEVLSCKVGSVEKVIESHLLNMIKQSDCIKFGTAKRVQSLLKKDHQTLWNSFKKQVSNDSYEQYWEVNKRIVERGENEFVRCVPFRLYDGDKPVFMKPISPLDEDRQSKTLGVFLSEVDESLVEVSLDNQVLLSKNIKVLIQGVEPSLDTPILWLIDFCSNPDNFLHIAIIRPEISTSRSSNSTQSMGKWSEKTSKVFGLGKQLSATELK